MTHIEQINKGKFCEMILLNLVILEYYQITWDDCSTS